MADSESLRCGPLSPCSHFFIPGVRPANQASQLGAATGWPYQFVKLPPESQHTRRLLLDQHGLYAQLSALVLFFLVVVLRLALQSLGKIVQRRASDAESMLRSPGIPKHRSHRSRLSVRVLCRLRWWLGGDVECFGTSIGQRDELVFIGIWTSWLLFLCFHRTGNGKAHIFVTMLRFLELFCACAEHHDVLQTTTIWQDDSALLASPSFLSSTCWPQSASIPSR